MSVALRELPEAVRLALLGALGGMRGTCVTPGRKLGHKARRIYDRHGKRREIVASGVTLHESVIERITPTDGSAPRGRAEPADVLAKRGLGVHYTIHRPNDERAVAADVVVEQHAPVDRAVAHAGGWHNRRDVAFEIENCYRPPDGDAAIDRAIGGSNSVRGVRDVIEGRWVWRGRKRKHRLYVCPALSQLEALFARLTLLAGELNRSLWFPCIDERKGFKWGRSSGHKRRAEGRLAVNAHYRWHHADGLVPECYCWLRSLGFAPAQSYGHTLRMASAGKRWTPPPGG